MKELKDRIGERIAFVAELHGETEVMSATLRGVENGGIWIERQDFTDSLLEKFNVPHAEVVPVVFLPYHMLVMIFDVIEGTALSRKSYGV